MIIGSLSRKILSAALLRRAATGVMACLLAAGSCLSVACSTKKNTAASRQWQAFNTRYNVYFNGSEHYNEQIKTMERDYQDDYTQRVLMHPAEARANAKLPQPTGNFDRTIEKMQKAIQLHSIKKKPRKRASSQKDKEFRKREEFNPFLHNAWLMMGRAQYLNGDFLGAASTFFYISKHFRWLPQVVTEATLWQARSYCALDWNYEAENLLTPVREKQLVTPSLRELYNFVMADYLVRTGRYEQAAPYLSKAAKAAKGTQRNRLYFLLGQVYAQTGRRKEAYEAFRKAGSGHNTDYRTKFNARIKQSEVFTGTNVRGEINGLRSMARYQRNKEYLDQIWYAIGNLYMTQRDTMHAEEAYRTAVRESTRNGIDKALASLALGNLLFAKGDYVGAQPCYSEAVPQLPENYPDYKMYKRRSDVLDELAVYAGNLHLQDSLLALSKLPEDKQREACEKLAADYTAAEKKAAEDARREEYLAEQDAKGQQGGAQGSAAAPTQFTLNSDKSWYFYNNTAKQAGRTEFQRKWGARKLEDNWRRRNKTTYSDGSETTDYSGESGQIPVDSVSADQSLSPQQQDSVNRVGDPHFAEYYMKDIPRTDEQLQNCNDIIMEALYNIGLILKDKLEDYAAARRYFAMLEERYPDNIHRLDMYYNLYLMAARQNDTSQAEKWRQTILREFPESPYAQAMTDPDYLNKLRTMEARQEALYAETYDAYLNNDNTRVHTLTAQMMEEYPLSRILPKFVFVNALSYLTEKNYEKFKSELQMLLDKWPDTDMTPMASAIMTDLNKGRKPQSGGTNTRGMLWETRLTNDTVAVADDGQPVNFERDPDKPQLLVLAFARDSVNANQVLYDVARNNFTWFVVRDYDLEPMSFGNMGLLVIRGFANMRELEHYRSIMAREHNFDLPPAVRPIVISVANFDLLLRSGRSFEDYFRFIENPEGVEENEEVEENHEAAEPE